MADPLNKKDADLLAKLMQKILLHLQGDQETSLSTEVTNGAAATLLQLVELHNLGKIDLRKRHTANALIDFASLEAEKEALRGNNPSKSAYGPSHLDRVLNRQDKNEGAVGINRFGSSFEPD